MSHSYSLTLRTANRNDFNRPVCLLFLLVMLSAGISPQPLLLLFLAVLFFGGVWVAHTLAYFNKNDTASIAVIFPDGIVKLKLKCGDSLEGFLDGQQWSTGRMAVLRIVVAGSVRKLLILSSKQRRTGDFRRLNIWLRQASTVAA
jgi:hypothetical protein